WTTSAGSFRAEPVLRMPPDVVFPRPVTTTTSADEPNRTASENEAMARNALRTSRFADVRWVESTGSTNADVLDLARAGEPEGIVLVADHQEAGRGRRGRSWQAPPGRSLMTSVLLRPPAAVAGLVT